MALQSRLAALYPEYTLCEMPSAALRGGAIGDFCFIGFNGTISMAGTSGELAAWAVSRSLPPKSSPPGKGVP